MLDVLLARTAVRSVAPQLQQMGITSVFLFGSRAKGTNLLPVSDWDLLIVCSRPLYAPDYWHLKASLAQALQGSVDLSSPQYSEPWFIDCICDDLIELYHAV